MYQNCWHVLQYAASYDPYGVPFETSGSLTASLGYTGEFTDPNGLVYLRARYMQPGYGTFLSKDPFEGVMERVMSRNPCLCHLLPTHTLIGIRFFLLKALNSNQERS